MVLNTYICFILRANVRFLAQKKKNLLIRAITWPVPQVSSFFPRHVMRAGEICTYREAHTVGVEPWNYNSGTLFRKWCSAAFLLS